MKPLKFVFLVLLIIASLAAGFLSSYSIAIISVVLFAAFNIVNLLIKEESGKQKCVFFAISFFSLVVVFHVGLLVRTNLSPVCYEGIPKNFSASRYNARPISLEQLDKSIATFSEFKIDTLKRIDFNDKDFYIKRLSSKNKGERKTKILVIAGTHGSETANVYAVQKILEHIRLQNLHDEFYFEIIYALNPVGLSFFYRFNECNCNINRDFMQFKTVQAQLLRDLVKEHHFDYALDLHEGPYDGQYFINNTSIKNLKENILKGFEKENIAVSPMMKNSVKDFLFQYEIDNPVARIKQIMTFDMYLKSVRIQNILSESDGLSTDFDKRIQGHVVVFDKLIEGIQKDN